MQCNSILFQINAQSLTNAFIGNFSSEGDITAKGIMKLELAKRGTKIEGVSNYRTNNGNLDSGLLSVNGYLKGDIAYIRFRDQRGNTVADGSINYHDNETLYFKQTTRSSILPPVAYLYMQAPTLSDTQKSYSGKYSNEGDTTANGIISFEIDQKESKIEGVANYKTFDNKLNSGVLSVNGYLKEGIAYIRFRDQRGNIVADGALSQEEGNIIFRQTTLANILPHYAVLYK